MDDSSAAPALGFAGARSFWVVLGAVSIAFHLWLIFSGLIPNLISRPLHMALALPWALVFLARTKRAIYSGLAIGVPGLGAVLWIAIKSDDLSDQYGFLEGSGQIAIAIILLATVLEMARRAIGWPLPIVAVLALAYGIGGHLIPGEFGHAGAPLASFLGALTIAEGGLWGQLTGVSVSIVAIFVIFGAVLNAGEAGQGFMNLAGAAAGRLKGGAAKVSVLSSALFGSISGSASANVASTGAITLPAMRGLGYPRAFAGGVEAVASSGGQIMPPLMGAGAFVMVELTGIPYEGIMAAAILPAILYFAAVWIGINAFATRYELKGLPPEQRPRPRDVIITAGFFAIPFTVLLWAMFFGFGGRAFTPQFAACLAIIAAAILLLVDSHGRIDRRRAAHRISDACLNAGKQVAMIASIILCASIIIGVLGITGLGVKITSLILSGSGGALWPALLLTAGACLLLGMEVPTTAAYVICISIAGPALIDLGLAPLQAHLFVFWFALLSTITPPVCGAVFIAAGMVEENWLKVAGAAMALGLGLYFIPLAMIAHPDLIGLADAPVPALIAMAQVLIGLGCLSWGIIAMAPIAARAALIVGGLCILLWPAII